MAVSRLGRTTGRTATWAQSLAPTIAIDATHNECEDQPCFHEVSVGHMFNEIERNMGGAHELVSTAKLMLGSGQRAGMLLSRSQLLQTFELATGRVLN